LAKTAVSYINIDIAVSGPYPGIRSTPEMFSIAEETMRKVAYPKGANVTMWDFWQQVYQYTGYTSQSDPLGSGSDYTAFVHQGISSVMLPPLP
jgi:N-acetylated-alpha-linked acidic dipeptidase